MPYPFLRASEADKVTPGPTPGVLVVTPSGKKYFFPSSTPEEGMWFVKETLDADTLGFLTTSIEFGSKNGSAWKVEKVIKKADTPPEPLWWFGGTGKEKGE